MKLDISMSNEALLEFYVASGLDCFLDEVPHDRFAETIKAREERRELALQQALPKKPLSQTPTQQFHATKQNPAPRFISPSQQAGAELDPANIKKARGLAQSATTLDALRQVLESYDGCPLKRTASNLVFGSGSPEAHVMFIGEAPGRDEDQSGLPFVGRSGQLLDRMLAAIGLQRERDTYIANVVPWRPPGNRTPTPLETEICRPFIERQIELVGPSLIVLLGGASAKQLLQTNDGILKLRGKEKTLTIGDKSYAALATLHPAYLLRQPQQKRLAWMDLLKVQSILDRL